MLVADETLRTRCKISKKIWTSRTLASGVMKFTFFGRLFPGLHSYILSLSDLCPGVEWTFFIRNIAL